MATINMAVKHGQTWDAARANFIKGVEEARTKQASYIQSVEFNEDRTSAKLKGKGFEVTLKVDPESVHANGSVPLYVKFLEGPIRRFVEQTFAAK